LDIENSKNVLKDKPERLATCLQYFLQGIGLLSAMPMKSNIIQSKLSLYGRSISMEEADRPISSSIQSDSLTSPMVSSNPSITDSN
jgi:protein NDRG1